MTHQPTRPTAFAASQKPIETRPNDALSDDLLQHVSGGTSNIMKTKHDTAKNTISNIH